MKPNRQALRAARATLTEENKRWPSHLVSVPPEQWPDVGEDELPVAFWRSRTILVMAYDAPDGWVRLSICRTALNSQGHWKDGLTWDELQRIKSQIGYGDRDAIEIYPPDRDVVNVANIRHLWVAPEPLRLAWRA